MSLIVRFIRIPVQKKLVLLETLLNSSLALIMIRVLPYDLWKRWLGEEVSKDNVPTILKAPHRSANTDIHNIAWAHAKFAQRFDNLFTCLMLGFSARAMMRRRGYPSLLVLGASRKPKSEGNTLRAHAWVIYQDMDIAGGSIRSDYALVAAYSDEKSSSVARKGLCGTNTSMPR